MIVGQNPATWRILDLCLEIIYLLVGEDHTVVKIPDGKDGDGRSCQMSEGYRKTQRPIMEPPPLSPIHERHNEQKILELTHRILRLLTGEVPIRCEDVAVHLSVEEWEYVERHKELYKDVMTEDHQPVITADSSVSGDSHSSVSLPDFGIKNGIEIMTNDGGMCLKSNRDKKGEAESAAYKEQEPPAFKGTQATGKDIYPTTGHSQTGYPPPDIKEEPASCDEGNLADPDVYKPTEHTQTEHPSTYVGKDSANPLGLKSSDFRKPDGNINHKADEPPAVVGRTDLLTRSLVKGDSVTSSEMGSALYSESDHEVNCRDKEVFSSDFRENFTHETHHPKRQTPHKEEQAFWCSECEECFTDRVALKIHQRVHVGKAQFKCSECGKCFTLHYELVRHQRIHTGEKPFKCTECWKCFTWASQLDSHKWVHSGETPFKCPECGKYFSLKASLIRHLKTHTGEKPFKCTECGKCFIEASGLSRHRLTHTGEKPFTCHECGECFTTASDLARHSVIHTGEKPFKCPDCGERFTWSSQLSSHKWVHSGEKPFSCSECGKCFTSNSYLNIHLKIHTGEKPFKCPECGKCFTWLTQLDSHKWVHSGEKPFSCSECGKRFSSNSYLKKHRRTHTETI